MIVPVGFRSCAAVKANMADDVRKVWRMLEATIAEKRREARTRPLSRPVTEVREI
jgi:hypothetical protein